MDKLNNLDKAIEISTEVQKALHVLSAEYINKTGKDLMLPRHECEKLGINIAGYLASLLAHYKEMSNE